MIFGFDTTAEEAATIFKENIVGKNVLITGGSPKSLAAENIRVIAPYAKTIVIASRSQERAQAVIDEVHKESPKADIRFVHLDLTSKESILSAAKDVLALDIPLNVVINNAAVIQPNTLTRSRDGFEVQFGANHLGHFLFISLIQPAILRAVSSSNDPPRIVVLASEAANWVKEFRWDDVNYTERPQEYEKFAAYGASKYANVAFTSGLVKRLGPKGVLAFVLHPGLIITTNMASAATQEEYLAFGAIDENGTPASWIKSAEKGAATQVIAAFDPSLASQNGAYLEDGRVQNDKVSAHARTEETADRLWKLSEKLMGIKF